LGTADSITEIIDVNEEDDPKLSEKLTEISKKHDAVLMACIAPYVGLKVSPTKTVNAQMGQLSPLDPQAKIEDGVVSANSIVDAHQFVTRLLDDVTVEDAPYSYKALADKCDGVDIRDALASLSLMEDYIREIVEDCGYSKEECKKISNRIVRGFKTHDEVINIDKAKKLGLNVVPHSDFPVEWKLFREWLAKYMLQSADKHVIRFVISENLTKQGELNKK